MVGSCVGAAVEATYPTVDVTIVAPTSSYIPSCPAKMLIFKNDLSGKLYMARDVFGVAVAFTIAAPFSSVTSTSYKLAPTLSFQPSTM